MRFFDMVSEDDFRKAVRESAEVQAGLDELAAEVKSYWQEVAPKDTGQYAASLKIRKMKDKDGQPMRRVTNTSGIAHLLEYGSKHNKKLGIRARVETHFKSD